MLPDAAWPWSVLGLPAMPPEPADIRRAYAKALKKIDQSKDIKGFANLRDAYERGLAIRESRTSQNAAKRARKSQETPQNVPAGARDDQPPPALYAALTPAEIATNAKQAETNVLLTALSAPNPLIDPGKRITDALANPLSQDPDCAQQIRFAIASIMRSSIVSDEYNEPALSSEISADILLALDTRFGWLNDYAAFRQDFWGNTQLQYLIAARAYGNISRPKTPRRKKRSGFLGAILDGIREIFELAPMIFLLAYMTLVRALIAYNDRTSVLDDRTWLVTAGLITALAPGFIILAYVAHSIYGDMARALKNWARKISRWRIVDWFFRRIRR